MVGGCLEGLVKVYQGYTCSKVQKFTGTHVESLLGTLTLPENSLEYVFVFGPSAPFVTSHLVSARKCTNSLKEGLSVASADIESIIHDAFPEQREVHREGRTGPNVSRHRPKHVRHMLKLGSIDRSSAMPLLQVHRPEDYLHNRRLQHSKVYPLLLWPRCVQLSCYKPSMPP